MDRQLRELAEMFRRYGIRYWVDSGTLLGLVRDGRLMEHDRDLDLSVWESELEQLLGFTRECARDLGYLVDVYSFHGMTYCVKLRKTTDHSERKVDIKVFRVFGDDAWCPVSVPRVAYTRAELRRLLRGNIRDLLRVPERALWGGVRRFWEVVTVRLQRFTGIRHIDHGKRPWNKGAQVWSWRFPARLVGDTIEDQSTGFRIPAMTCEYLSYRYGDWTVPAVDWVYFRDDGAISRESVDKIIKSYADIQAVEGRSHAR